MNIEVKPLSGDDPMLFKVTIQDDSGSTQHEVSLSRELWHRLATGTPAPEVLVAAAFRFLLDREGKESILGRFDMAVISRYFPEFESEIAGYLQLR